VDALRAAFLCLLGATLFLSPLVASRFEPVFVQTMHLLTLVALLAFLVRQRLLAKPLAVTPLDGWLLAFLGWALLSIISSVYKHATLTEFLNLANGAILLWLLVQDGRSPAVFGAMAFCLLASAGVASIIGLREYGLSGDPSWRTFSTFFNPNLFATFLITLFPLGIGFLLTARHRMVAFISGLIVALMAAALMATGSRAGVGCGMLGVLVFGVGILWRRPVLPKAVWGRALVVILLVALASLRVARPLVGRIATTTTAQAHSGSFRVLTWQATLDMARAHPLFGTGLGTYGSVFPQYARSGYTGMAHNSFLQYASETGLPGLAFFLLFLLSFAWKAGWPLFRGFGGLQDVPKDSPFALFDPGLVGPGLVGGILASAAHNLVDYGWYLFGAAMPFWAILGLGAALAPPSPVLSGVRARIFLGFGGLYALIFAVASIPLWLAGLSGSRAQAALAEGDVRGALEAYRTAARLDPLDALWQCSPGQILAAKARQTGNPQDIEEALSHFRKAIALQPTDAIHRYWLGKMLSQAGRLQEAVSTYHEALQVNPHSTAVLLELARTYERVGQKEEALATYRRLADQEKSAFETVKAIPELIDTRYAEAHRALGKEAAASGSLQEAISHYKAALGVIDQYQKALKASPAAYLDQERGKTEAIEQMRQEIMRELELEERKQRQGGL